MKCVIFAGGKGNRIRTENDDTPKPLVKIGDKPIIWHIMKIYSFYGINNFILCLGYNKEMFYDFFNDIDEEWNVELVDTGLDTQTGARLKLVEKYLDDNDFCLTYGDAVSDININELIEYHKKNNKLLTLSTVKAKERFGIFEIEDNSISSYREKELRSNEWVNGGFMIVNRKVLDLLTNDSGTFENDVIKKLLISNDIGAYKHSGFWQCMDYRDEQKYLEDLIKNKKNVWRKWDE